MKLSVTAEGTHSKCARERRTSLLKTHFGMRSTSPRSSLETPHIDLQVCALEMGRF